MKPRAILILALVAVACLLGAGGEEKFPSVEDAMKRDIHGKHRIRKNVIEVGYDFKTPDQATDFVQPAGKVQSGAGKLMLGEQRVNLRIPFKAVQTVSLRVQGANDINVTLTGGGEALVVQIGSWTRMFAGKVLGWDGGKHINLTPDKPQRIEIIIGAKDGMTKLDGKKVLETDFPEGFPLMESVSIYTESKGAHISEFQVNGMLADDAVVIAANRGRAAQKLAPLWPEKCAVAGTYFDVASGGAREVAERWGGLLEAQAGALLGAYPPPPDRGAFKRTVYLFDNPRVYAAYMEGMNPPSLVLADGSFVFFLANATPDVERWLLRVSAAFMIEATLPVAPYWWSKGYELYYSQWEMDGSTHCFGKLTPEAARTARAYLDRREDPVLSTLLAGWRPEKPTEAPSALCWAWVSFLEYGEGGIHKQYLKDFHSALIAGKSGKEAGEAVFTTERFNELFPRFKVYIEAM